LFIACSGQCPPFQRTCRTRFHNDSFCRCHTGILKGNHGCPRRFRNRQQHVSHPVESLVDDAVMITIKGCGRLNISLATDSATGHEATSPRSQLPTEFGSWVVGCDFRPKLCEPVQLCEPIFASEFKSAGRTGNPWPTGSSGSSEFERQGTRKQRPADQTPTICPVRPAKQDGEVPPLELPQIRPTRLFFRILKRR